MDSAISGMTSRPRRNRKPGVAVWHRVSLRILAVGLLGATLHGAPDLTTVLENMDAAAVEWKGMRAQVELVHYMALVDDTRVDSGRIAMRRSRDGGVEMLLAIQDPFEYYIAVRGTTAERYKPSIKTVEEFDLSKSKDELESALLLGLGTAGSYLDKHYEISMDSSEPIANHPVVKLALQPRDPDGETNNHPLEMWISTKTWQPVQRKKYGAIPGDYQLQSYSEIEMNPTFKGNEFKLNLKRGTNRVRPQW